MNELLTFLYIVVLILIGAWCIQLGAHPNSARTTIAAIIMSICVLLILATVVLSVLNLLITVWVP